MIWFIIEIDSDSPNRNQSQRIVTCQKKVSVFNLKNKQSQAYNTGGDRDVHLPER